MDQLPPEARFALRAVAAGFTIDDAGAILRLDGPTVRKHLRTAGRGLGVATPPPSEADAALLAALAPALAEAKKPPSRLSSKRCPGPDVAAALAAAQLDGPLMLAEIDHAADCPRCLTQLVALRRAGARPADPAAARKPVWPVLLGTAIGLGAAGWYLFG